MRRLSRRQRWAAIALAAVAAVFLTLDLAGAGLQGAHGGVRGAFGALYRGTDSVLGPVRRFVQGVPGAASNQDKINQLEAENARLRQQLDERAMNERSATQLADLQLAARSGGYKILPARVTALSPGQGFDWTVTLDAGASSGVKVGQTVTDGHGLVGRVIRADDSSSLVLLAVDPGSGVGVRDARSGELGLAAGDGTDGFTFTPIASEAKVKVGDELISGPAGKTSYVAGLSLGTVTAVQTAPDGSTKATVRPTASATSLDLVGVVLVGGHATHPRAPLNPNTPQAGGR